MADAAFALSHAGSGADAQGAARLFRQCACGLPTCAVAVVRGFSRRPACHRGLCDRAAAGWFGRFFRAYCGLDLPDTLSDAEDRNPGLHPALFEIARQATHGLETAEFAALRDLLFALPPKGLPDAREVDFLDAGTRRALLAHFTPIHDWLAGLTGSTTFFDDLDDIARPRRLSHLEAARIALPLVRAAAERAGNDGLCSFLRGLEIAA